MPITVITCEDPPEMLREWMAQGHPSLEELAKVCDAKLVDLPTGHWPQFTKPAELGAAIVEALTWGSDDSRGSPVRAGQDATAQLNVDMF